jgi:hypothetical protein
MEHLPENAVVSVHPLATEDGAAVTGFLYRTAGSDSKTVLCIMHPREFLATHYLIPEILAGGHNVWTQTSRSVGSDLRLEHETALLDVAAGISFLRDAGFEHIILVGNSGGASLFGFYNQQSLLAAERRLERSPGGRRTSLRTAAMPEVDGLIFVSPHPGQGIVLLNCIDPSVIDEADPLSVDPTLDCLDVRNGYREGPEGSRYAPAFIERYRHAQRKRVERLDQAANQLIETRIAARNESKKGGRREDRVRGAHTPVMTIWRTDADLRCWDPTIDPSDRALGSIWGEEPYASNYSVVGFARFCTPEAWLSTWSGISSRANLLVTAPSVEQPCLLIDYTGDRVAFPADMTAIYNSIRSTVKRRISIRGDHHGHALSSEEDSGRVAAGKEIRSWLRGAF